MSSRRLPDFQYLKPTTIEEACALLSKHMAGATVLAGGTDLLVRMRQRLSTPQYVISLSGIPSLDYINYDEHTGLTIGALTTIDSLANSPLIKEKYAILRQAARQTSALPLRYMSSVGGNICLDTRCIYYNQSRAWRQRRAPCFKRGGQVCHVVKGGDHCYSVYQGDLAPPLVALEARVRISSVNGERVTPLTEFFTGSGETPNILSSDDILTEIQIPSPPPNILSSYQKLRVRQALDFPLAGVALVLTMNGGSFQKVKVVLGAVLSSPIEVDEAEEILQGSTPGDGLIERAAQAAYEKAHPVDNLSMAASYRRKMIRVLFKRALNQALSTGNK